MSKEPEEPCCSEALYTSWRYCRRKCLCRYTLGEWVTRRRVPVAAATLMIMHTKWTTKQQVSREFQDSWTIATYLIQISHAAKVHAALNHSVVSENKREKFQWVIFVYKVCSKHVPFFHGSRNGSINQKSCSFWNKRITGRDVVP